MLNFMLMLINTCRTAYSMFFTRLQFALPKNIKEICQIMNKFSLLSSTDEFETFFMDCDRKNGLAL